MKYLKNTHEEYAISLIVRRFINIFLHKPISKVILDNVHPQTK